MINKEYYRLEELAKRFDVTFDAVRYWVEAGELNLAFHVNNKKFVLGGWQKGKGFIAFGVANYRGLVSISANEQLELIEKSSVNCRNFQLLNKSAIANQLTDYPFKSPIPNKLIAEWRPKAIEQIVWDVVPAKIFPNEQQNSAKSVSQSVLSAIEALGNKSLKEANVDTSTIDNLPDYQFDFNDLEFVIKDICITHAELVRLGVAESPENELQPQSSVEDKLPELIDTQVPEKRVSQLTTLIERIVIANPKIKAIEVWRLLKREVETDSLDREYDIEGILKDITINELFWDSRYGHSSTVKKSTFDAKVSRIRTKLGVNKK